MNYMKSKNGMIATGVIVLLLIAYFCYMDSVNAYVGRMLGKVEDNDKADLDKEKVLSKGSKGLEVKALQSQIAAGGGELPKYGADGIFGNETEVALMKMHSIKKVTLAGFESLHASIATNTGFAGGQTAVKEEKKTATANNY